MTTQTLAPERPQAVASDIKVYWKPGCSNCIRLKEYVTKRGFTFEAVDLMQQPERMSELEALGIRGIPVITRGDKAAYGLDLDQVDAVLGVTSDTSGTPSPQELVKRMIAVTEAAMRFGRQLPEPRYNDPLPGRAERSYLGLVNHVVAHLSRFVAVVDGRGWDFTDVKVYSIAGDQPQNKDPLDPAITYEDIRKRAEGLLVKAQAWLDLGGDPEDPVEMFYGPQTVRQIIESNCYSVVQHTRQLQAVITFLGFEPDGPIGDKEYVGLRLPKALWDEVE